jgi:uncharacterized protein
MYAITHSRELSAPACGWAQPRARAGAVRPLTNEQTDAVLAFLSARPVHTVCMAGFVRDNGLESPLNRGTFYGYVNDREELEGVALIGHITLMETQSDDALRAFARLARNCQNTFLVMGEQERIAQFWRHYAANGRQMRRACRELLFEQRWPLAIDDTVEGLRQATLDDLELVLPVHAQMAEEESGVNPLLKDPEGFRERTARRIMKGRVWVLVEQGRLIFKADVVSDTPDCIYLEGVWVNPEERGQGHALRCLGQLERTLLKRTRAICLLVNEENKKAQALYRKAGYRLRGSYDSIFI